MSKRRGGVGARRCCTLVLTLYFGVFYQPLLPCRHMIKYRYVPFDLGKKTYR